MTNKILSVAGIVSILIIGFIIGRGCKGDEPDPITTIEIHTDTVFVDVADVTLDTVYLAGQSGLFSERVNFRHEDSLILIQGYTHTRPPSAHIEYYIRPQTITITADSIYSSIPAYTISLSGSSLLPRRPRWFFYLDGGYNIGSQQIKFGGGVGFQVTEKVAIKAGLYDNDLTCGLVVRF